MVSPLTAQPLRRALLGNAAGNFAVVAALLLALAGGLILVLDLRMAFLAKALLVFMGGALLFIPPLLRDHPFPDFGPANRVTLLRGMLIALLAGFLGEPVSTAAALTIVGIGLVALVLDGFDGKLARSSKMSSAFGARFDMETDAVLVLLFSVLAWQLDKAGPWVILSGLLRYLFLAAGWVLPWMRAPLLPSRRRQTVCVIQIAVMLAVLLPFVLSPWSDLLAAGTLCLLLYSFVVDAIWLRKSANLSG